MTPPSPAEIKPPIGAFESKYTRNQHNESESNAEHDKEPQSWKKGALKNVEDDLNSDKKINSFLIEIKYIKDQLFDNIQSLTSGGRLDFDIYKEVATDGFTYHQFMQLAINCLLTVLSDEDKQLDVDCFVVNANLAAIKFGEELIKSFRFKTLRLDLQALKARTKIRDYFAKGDEKNREEDGEEDDGESKATVKSEKDDDINQAIEYHKRYMVEKNKCIEQLDWTFTETVRRAIAELDFGALAGGELPKAEDIDKGLARLIDMTTGEFRNFIDTSAFEAEAKRIVAMKIRIYLEGYRLALVNKWSN